MGIRIHSKFNSKENKRVKFKCYASVLYCYYLYGTHITTITREIII